MKRLLFLLAVFSVTAVSLFADEISYFEAESCARAFFAGQGHKKQSTIAVRKVSYKANAAKAGKCEPFYVFNNASDQGFVIISGDDCVLPIIAFSNEGSFCTENMPDNLRAWLEDIEKQIAFVKNRKIKSLPATSAKWNSVRNAGYTVKPVLLHETAKWNQFEPYNLKTPLLADGRSTATGCVQTATAIYMKFFEYPSTPTKDIENIYHIDSDNLDHHGRVPATPDRYQWDNMLMEYNNSSYTTAQANAVATLMSDLGIMNGASYGRETGAYTGNSARNLIEYMGYSKAAHIKERDDYSRKEWADLLRSELNSGHPVLYAGAGHSYIIDGYAEDDYFHINWGWSGHSDAYFIVDLLTHNQTEKYVFGQYAAFGLVPDPDGTSKEEPYYLVKLRTFTLYPDMMARLTPETTVESQITNIYNVGDSYISPFTLSLNLMSSNHTKVSNLKTWELASQLGSYHGYTKISGITFSLPRVRFGDYVKVYFMHPDYSNVEMPVHIYIQPVEERGVIPVIDASFIEAKDSYKAGEQFEKTIFYGRQMPATEVWTYDGTINEDVTIPLSAGRHTIKVVLTYSDGSSETIVREIVVK